MIHEINGKRYEITWTWDDDAGVHVLTSPDVPGLVTTAHSLDDANGKLALIIPALEARDR